MALIKALSLLLKSKKATAGVIKKVTGGMEAITGVAPKVSEKVSALKVTGWVKRMQSKLKNK